jgi:uncharacterized protein YbbC (DUF1343 family)
MVSIITASPRIIPKMPIFTIGLEIWFPDDAVILSAMYFSRFKLKSVNKNKHLIVLLTLYLMLFTSTAQNTEIKPYKSVITGAEQFEKYITALKGKRVAVVTNQTGLIRNTSIVDTLLSLKINVRKIFGPEHGFRGNTEAGEKVSSNIDAKTRLPVISLYGSNKKPAAKDLQDVDIVVYDIQDLGVRFYTYISTMCYVMEACAENKKPLIVLDRPNPNGFYIDGPVLKEEFSGFLGLHPVPVVYGMTCGEYAQMVNSEGWLKNKVKCSLTVIPCRNYERKCSYDLPVKPSPNIPNIKAILLYPSLGLFEGTVMSLGRGTDMPFQVIGHPQFGGGDIEFTPKPSKLSAKPKYVNEACRGLDLRESDYITNHPGKIELRWLIESFSNINQVEFFDKNFNYHAGNSELQKQIKEGMDMESIRQSWQEDIGGFKKIRKNYLLYPDFE